MAREKNKVQPLLLENGDFPSLEFKNGISLANHINDTIFKFSVI